MGMRRGHGKTVSARGAETGEAPVVVFGSSTVRCRLLANSEAGRVA